MAVGDIDRSEIMVPKPEVVNGKAVPWPTLGPQVVSFIENTFVYGPGILKGEPYKLRREFKYLISRMYEHYPDGHVLQYGTQTVDKTGRRRFQRVVLSLPKGSAKSELMAIIALTELHPDAPIRFNGYDPKAPGGMAPGRSVMSPYIPLLAPTLDQLKDLAYGVAAEIIQLVDADGLFDVTNDRIMIRGERDSKIIPIAASPKAADGAKTTFQGIDEPHRLTEDRHIDTVTTMQNNLPKRYGDDPWQLTTTTAGNPNEDSVALREFEAGMEIYHGVNTDPDMFFYHRGTTDANAKFDTMENRLIALKEASGREAAEFRDLAAVAKMWDDKRQDHAYLERVWCNRWVKSAKTAFDVVAFKALGDEELTIPLGARVTLGFDGALTQDSTALVMTEVETGIQNIVGLWERPDHADQWSVPIGEVTAAVEDCFENYDVLLMYADPPYWQSAISDWEGKYGNRVVEWPTRNEIKIYYAIKAYEEAIYSGAVSHNGDQKFVSHIASAGRNYLGRYDADGMERYRLVKVAQGRKYDAAMAAILSWQARNDALAMGAHVAVASESPWRIR